MKKLLLLTLFAFTFVGSSLQAATASENFIGFKTWCSDKKLWWMNYSKNKQNAKYTLKINHTKEWSDFGINMLKKFEGVKDENAKQAIFEKELQNAVDIKVKHMNDWRNLSNSYHEEASEKYNKSVEELKAFAKKAGVKMNESLLPLQPKMQKKINNDEIDD